MSEDEWWSNWFRRRWPFFSEFGRFDEIYKEMEDLMETEFKQLSSKAPKELIRERTLPDGRRVKQWGPFVYGYSVTIGPDGKPQVKEFGNVKHGTKRGRPRIEIKEQREPLVDILETNGDIKVVAEMPGVEKKNIKLHGSTKTLTISVNTPNRKYFKEVQLPAEVDPSKGRSTYKNGVLDVTMPKKAEETSAGEPINIE